MPQSAQTREEFARMLFALGAFQDRRASPQGRGFRLKLHERNPSAPLSPFYFSLRAADNPKAGEHQRDYDSSKNLPAAQFRFRLVQLRHNPALS